MAALRKELRDMNCQGPIRMKHVVMPWAAVTSNVRASHGNADNLAVQVFIDPLEYHIVLGGVSTKVKIVTSPLCWPCT